MSILTAPWPGKDDIRELRRIEYRTCGTCCKQIDVEVDGDNRVAAVCFHGGCHGNTQGIARLVVGMDADDVQHRLAGVICGNKGTSCPDQLAKALQALKQESHA